SPEVTTRRARPVIGGDELMLLLEGNRVKCQTRKDLEVIRSIAAPFNLRLAIRKERRTDDAPEQGPLRPRRGSSGEQPLKEVRRHRCGQRHILRALEGRGLRLPGSQRRRKDYDR